MLSPERIKITGQALSLRGHDIDTDRIIPARFLKCVTFDGLGEHAFRDDREQAKTANVVHPFDDPRVAEAQLLFVQRNFGCGSSREHAPQSLARWGRGIQAIVGESFAEIFFGNCVALGIPCVTADANALESAFRAQERDPQMQWTLDLESMSLRGSDETEISVRMPSGAREQLLSGLWDSTAELLASVDAVDQRLNSLPYSAW